MIKNKNEGISMNLNQIKIDKTFLEDKNLDTQIVSSQRYCQLKASVENLQNKSANATKLLATLKDYDIYLPYKFLILLNDEQMEKMNILKFKRVQNLFIKEIERLKDNKKTHNINVTFENTINLKAIEDDLTAFYTLAYNLGAFSENEATRTLVCNFLKDKLTRGELKIKDIKNKYRQMKLQGEKQSFTDFYIKNFTKLNKDKDDIIVTKIYNNFEKLQSNNTSNKGNQKQLKPNLQKFKEILSKAEFHYTNEEEKVLALELSKFFNSESTFKEACKILELFKEQNINESIVKDLNSLNSTQKGTYTYEWLAKNDARNFTLGKYCNCCANIESVGYSIVRASILDENVQNLVIKQNGNIVAKATIYVNRKSGYAVYNTLEVANNKLYIEKEEIFKTIQKATNNFVTAYNKENETPIKQVNVGLNSNDLVDFLQKDETQLECIDFSIFTEDGKGGYKGNAMRENGQACLYK
ncbi:MAG: hypothetical protein ACI4TX_03420 [Christensenellales bacterium]